jgi:serine/threonine protein kinase/Tfp pilus assembly protein PilF
MGRLARNLRDEDLFAHDAWASQRGTADSESLGRVGHYQLLAPIGRGGLGVVFRARDPDGRDVAVKVLRRPDSNDDLLRFEREMKLLSLFGAREGFVPLLDRGESDRGPFLVMPLLEGGTLRDRLEAGPFRIADAIALVRSLAEAVGRAHERGIVHRDLKPENVLFQAGKPLVSDLGLAKHFLKPTTTRGESLSRTGDLRGTLHYMAPEQARDAKSAGPGADVFSLGAILYECLGGRAAFEGESVASVVRKTEKAAFEPLRTIRPEVPPWLAGVVGRALEPEAAERFPDGHAFARALVPPSRALVPGRRAFFGLIGLGVVVLAGMLVAPSWPTPGRASRVAERPPAPTPARPVSPSALELAALADTRLASRDFDGAIAYASKAIELDPKLSLAWTYRGQARFNSGDWDGAITDATKAIEIDPRSSFLPWMVRASAEVKRGDFDQAIADSTKAIDLDSSVALAFLARGQARGRKGTDLEGAIVDLTKAIELDPRLAVAWYSRGYARTIQRDWDGALPDLTKAIELAPEVAMAWAARARAQEGKGDHNGAMADSTKAIELDPRSADAWSIHALVRGHTGDWAGAIEDATKAIELDAKFTNAFVTRGAGRANTGDFQGALVDFERALELDPNGPDAARVRVMIDEAKKRISGR